MKDLKNPKLIWIKGGMFLAIGTISASLLLFETPTLRGAILLGLAIWAFCRAYYFAFYVIGKYVDPEYKFSGLLSFAAYVVGKIRSRQDRPNSPDGLC